MGLKISREVSFGRGSRSFRFENFEDRAEDQKQYEEGRILEEGRFREGSLAQRIYALLSSNNEPPEPRSRHSTETVEAKQSAKSKSRKSAA
jgi:hypothetical protein